MELRLNHIILVPTDFSEVCENAIDRACKAAKLLNYKVTLLHVINQETKSWLKEGNKNEAYVSEKLQALALEKQNAFGVEVTALVREGSIFSEISETATDIGADLIYLGTHGKEGIQHLTGSFALKVVTSSPVPVIVVQKKPLEHIYHNIVLPITSDAGPLEKTQWASYIARTFDAKIIIYQSDDPSLQETIDFLTGFFVKNKISYSIAKSSKAGSFSQQLVEFATSVNADLIMIMTSPDKGWKSFFLGKYEEELIYNTSQIPVMCINPRKYNWEKITPFGY